MKTYNMKETASRIRDLRKIHRYTQEQAAELHIFAVLPFFKVYSVFLH